MTRLLAWRDEWSLGIDALDEDHRGLVAALVDIGLRYCPQAMAMATLPPGARTGDAAARVGAPPKDLVEALCAFGQKVHAHCRREEAFMRAIDYPRWQQHAAQHLALMATFDAMLDDYRRRGAQVFDEPGQAWVRDWLLGHIVDGDQDFARRYFVLCGLDEGDDWSAAEPPSATSAKQAECADADIASAGH